jgi:hypothetical protein
VDSRRSLFSANPGTRNVIIAGTAIYDCRSLQVLVDEIEHMKALPPPSKRKIGFDL